MEHSMEQETPLLAPENLPLDLGELGVVTEAELVMPGVYEAVLENPEMGVGMEAFIVLKSASEISEAAKEYGKTNPGHTELLVYSENETGNTRYIIDYELSRYRMLHHIPLPEGEIIRTTAAIGAEMYPNYFGNYPVPFLTPWGCTTRNKVIANGLYWLETERFQRGLAVAYPKFTDLSDGARSLSEPFDDGSALTNGQVPGYLFFKEANSSIPLFELIFVGSNVQLNCTVNRAALMNAIYQFHPEYAAQHNIAEQAGVNDGFSVLLTTLGVETEPQISPERIISLTEQAGTKFIDF